MQVPRVATDVLANIPLQMAGEILFTCGPEKKWKIEVLRRIGVPFHQKPPLQLLIDAFAPLPESWYGSVLIRRDQGIWVAEIKTYDPEIICRVFAG